MKTAVTMDQVARRAGVSLSTVSFLLNGTRPVSQATAAKIRQAMDDLGYRRNEMARALASRRSRIVALLLPTDNNLLEPTHMEFVAAAAATARQRGYHLVVWPSLEGPDDELPALANQQLADGVVLMEVNNSDARVEVLKQTSIPFVLIGRTRDDESAPFVDVDFGGTASAAVDRLSELGHRNIGFINHSAASKSRGYGPTWRMEAALTTSCEQAGAHCRSCLADDTAQGGATAVDHLLAEDPLITAFVVMNDPACFGVMTRLGQLGKQVPADVSVLSIISSPGSGARSLPVLSRLDAPGAQLASLGVNALIDELEETGEGLTGLATLLPCTLSSDGATLALAPSVHSQQ